MRRGIDHGFLAPYKVVRIDIDRDLQGWRPAKGQADKHGNLIEDRIYNQKDFDRTLVQVVAERVQYCGPDGKLITESLRDYTRTAVRKEYASLDDFLRRWSEAEQKRAVIAELESQGVLLDALAEELGKKTGKRLDPFDLICHVAFDRPALSRRERAEQVRKRDVFARDGCHAPAVLEALLDKYADAGIESI